MLVSGWDSILFIFVFFKENGGETHITNTCKWSYGLIVAEILDSYQPK